MVFAILSFVEKTNVSHLSLVSVLSVVENLDYLFHRPFEISEY